MVAELPVQIVAEVGIAVVMLVVTVVVAEVGVFVLVWE